MSLLNTSTHAGYGLSRTLISDGPDSLVVIELVFGIRRETYFENHMEPI